jgi:hypothetical protein
MEQRRFEKVRRAFSEPEIVAFKDLLAYKVREQLEQQELRAEAVGRFSATLKILSAEIAQLSDQLSSGSEWVDVELVILLDQPRPGLKTLVRVDNNEELRVEPMTPEDRQQSLGFEEPKEP